MNFDIQYKRTRLLSSLHHPAPFFTPDISQYLDILRTLADATHST